VITVKYYLHVLIQEMRKLLRALIHTIVPVLLVLSDTEQANIFNVTKFFKCKKSYTLLLPDPC